MALSKGGGGGGSGLGKYVDFASAFPILFFFLWMYQKEICYSYEALLVINGKNVMS